MTTGDRSLSLDSHGPDPVKPGSMNAKSFQWLMENSPAVIFRLSLPDGVCEYVSPAATHIFGYEPQRWYDNPRFLQQILHPDWSQLFEEQWVSLNQGSIQDTYEYQIVHGDGSHRWVIQRNVLIKDDQGKPVALEGVVTDITEQKRTEEALRASEEKMKSVFRATPVGIGLVADRVLLEVNELFCKMCGYSRSELVGQNARILYPTEEDYEYVGREKHRQILEHGTGTVETRFLCKDGTIIDVLMSSTPLDPDDRDGTVTFTALDITERKRAERALKASEEQLQTFLGNFPASVTIQDQELRYIYANRQVIEATRTSSEDWSGARAKDLFPETVSATIEQLSRRVLAEQIVVSEDLCLEWPPSGTRWMKFIKFPLEGPHGEQLVGGISLDFTEQKSKDIQLRQAQKMEAVGRLASGVAHDFNNQLTVVLGYADLLLTDRQEDDPLWDLISQIKQAAIRAQATTSHLLAFSRKQVLEPEVVAIDELLQGIEKPMARIIGEDVLLNVTVEPGTRPLLIDRYGLDQAIMNLVVNARDAMPGGGELSIKASNASIDEMQATEYPEAVPGEFVLLEVADTGMGMDEETMDRLFEPFFTTKEQGKGTGLGMPMVMGFIRQSNGFVRVDSHPGEGTTIRILLPATIENETSNKSKASPSQIEKEDRGATIMVVEDEEGVRSLIVQILERAGHSVLITSDPMQAEDLFRQHESDIDLVISDVIMPGMRGDELARRLMARGPIPPFLFVSGYADIEIEGQTLLQKPFSPRDLISKVQQLLQ